MHLSVSLKPEELYLKLAFENSTEINKHTIARKFNHCNSNNTLHAKTYKKQLY